jgi:tight adherence protein B
VIIQLVWLKWGGFAAVVLGGWIALWLTLARPEGTVRTMWAHYGRALDRDARFLFLTTSGYQIAMRQLMVGCAVLVVAALLANWMIMLAVPFVIFLPKLMLVRAKRARVRKIEDQLDGWLLMLANMLKATASLGEALHATRELVQPPLRQEVDLVLKEIQVGTSQDDAIRKLAERVNSRLVSAALLALLIGRSTGGDLPLMLEDASASAREIQLLERFVKNKTAEGRMQLFVLAVAPLVAIAGLTWMDEDFFDPLTDTVMGNALLGIAVMLWLMALISAKKILAVDV